MSTSNVSFHYYGAEVNPLTILEGSVPHDELVGRPLKISIPVQALIEFSGLELITESSLTYAINRWLAKYFDEFGYMPELLVCYKVSTERDSLQEQMLIAIDELRRCYTVVEHYTMYTETHTHRQTEKVFHHPGDSYTPNVLATRFTNDVPPLPNGERLLLLIREDQITASLAKAIKDAPRYSWALMKEGGRPLFTGFTTADVNLIDMSITRFDADARQLIWRLKK